VVWASASSLKAPTQSSRFTDFSIICGEGVSTGAASGGTHPSRGTSSSPERRCSRNTTRGRGPRGGARRPRVDLRQRERELYLNGSIQQQESDDRFRCLVTARPRAVLPPCGYLKSTYCPPPSLQSPFISFSSLSSAFSPPGRPTASYG